LFDELNLNHSLIKTENQLIHKILIDFSLKSRYLGITPVGFVYQKYKDLDGFRKWCEIQKDYGFSGVGCITPAQVEVANEVFKDEDLEYAKMIAQRFEKEGAFTIDGLFVDEPVYKNYKNMLKGKI
jgi:citrate lyase subunit beta/citryl-CoA lyase